VIGTGGRQRTFRGLLWIIRHFIQREKPMSIFRNVGAAVVVWAAWATAVPAQQAMSEPAYCAFFYPNANCQNKGPGNPYTDPNYRRNGGSSSGQWANATVTTEPKRTRRSHAPPQ
jgi:hypothetical protein